MTDSPAATAAPRPVVPGPGAGRLVLIAFGSLGALIAIALVLAGIGLVVAHTQRDEDGFFTTPTERFATDAYALTHETLEVGDISETPDWLIDRLGTVRVRATSPGGDALFIGLARSDDLSPYLKGVGYDEITSIKFDPFREKIRSFPGDAPLGPPGEQAFWAASSEGTGTRTFSWDISEGTWSLVLMNADGSRGVAADIELGAKAEWLLWIGFVLAGAGVLLGAGSAAMIVFGVRTPGDGGGRGTVAGGGAVPAAEQAAESTYPVAVEARLDEPLSRWLWLVKWFLAIPHAVVLAFLWIAFLVLTVGAFFAILFTGRYPRPIFDFNLGVMRWTWRVSYYAFSGIGTDRYPPFSLGAEPDYPATLDVAYPTGLSRGLVLVKSWLLALPHLIIVALFTGSAVWAWSGRYVEWPGLVTILTVVAGAILLFTGRYPRDIFELIVGLNRWVWRVVAYVALMRDEYPPFRLGR